MKKTKTYEDLVAYTVETIKNDCLEDGFENFAEMVQCYIMDSRDIKDYFSEIVRSYKKTIWVEDNGEITLDDESLEPYPYAPFARAVRKALK